MKKCNRFLRMDLRKINFDSCIKLNKTTMSIHFGGNVDNETILILPAKSFPFSRYDISEYYDNSTPWFNICGPIVLLMRELARHRHAWYLIMNRIVVLFILLTLFSVCGLALSSAYIYNKVSLNSLLYL